MTINAKRVTDFIVGKADRVTNNGNVANKIGTFKAYSFAKEFNIPFYSNTDNYQIKKQEKLEDIIIDEGDNLLITTGLIIKHN